MTGYHTMLAGIVGSTAYGLNGPDSDVDRLGIYAAPTTAFHGLHRPIETRTTTNPDLTLHEAAKWCRLALGCNPTVMELVWLPDDLYDVRTDLGNELIGIRTAFLTAKRVRSAYLGYAEQQFRRLIVRGDGSFSADTRRRTAKHARHLARLVQAGAGLYSTGQLEIRVSNPEQIHEFGERVAAGDLELARKMLADGEAAFDSTATPLPKDPDQQIVETWLHDVRRAYFS